MTTTTTPTTDTTGCARCTTRWAGLNTAHCPTCHQTFTTTSNFDRHRTGNHHDDTRHCLPPRTVGLIDAGRAYPCWGMPPNPSWDPKTSLPGVVTPDRPENPPNPA